MSTTSNFSNTTRRNFEGIRAKNGLNSKDLVALRETVNQVLRGELGAAGLPQSLTWDHILTLEGLGEKTVPKIINNIEASKERPLHRILFALGILHVGSEVAELLTQRYYSIDDIANASTEDLTQIPGIGPKIAESVVGYFQVASNREVIEKLRRAGVRLHQEGQPPKPGDQPWQGLTFVITGTLASMPRREAEDRVKALGGNATSSVTRKTSYLVAGESPGSKLDTAQRLGTPVLDEAAFLKLLEEPAAVAAG